MMAPNPPQQWRPTSSPTVKVSPSQKWGLQYSWCYLGLFAVCVIHVCCSLRASENVKEFSCFIFFCLGGFTEITAPTLWEKQLNRDKQNSSSSRKPVSRKWAKAGTSADFLLNKVKHKHVTKTKAKAWTWIQDIEQTFTCLTYYKG